MMALKLGLVHPDIGQDLTVERDAGEVQRVENWP